MGSDYASEENYTAKLKKLENQPLQPPFDYIMIFKKDMAIQIFISLQCKFWMKFSFSQTNVPDSTSMINYTSEWNIMQCKMKD